MKFENLARWRPSIPLYEYFRAFLTIVLGPPERIELETNFLVKSRDGIPVPKDRVFQIFQKIFFSAWRPYFLKYFRQKTLPGVKIDGKKLNLGDF